MKVEMMVKTENHTRKIIVNAVNLSVAFHDTNKKFPAGIVTLPQDGDKCIVDRYGYVIEKMAKVSQEVYESLYNDFMEDHYYVVDIYGETYYLCNEYHVQDITDIDQHNKC